jgi:GTP-binding protein
VAADDFPRDGAAEIALVGRSNVGKSTLVNALVGTHAARTSAEPGKTRLVNIYRVERPGASPLYLVDLPGYGFARGTASSPSEAPGSPTRHPRWGGPPEGSPAKPGRRARASGGGAPRALENAGPLRFADLADLVFERRPAALLLVDARHPGLESDVAAWRWIRESVDDAAIAATKIDKLARGERIRALRQLESVFEHPVAPVSARTGEGLDELWKVIDRLANSHNNSSSRRRRPSPATERRRP